MANSQYRIGAAYDNYARHPEAMQGLSGGAGGSGFLGLGGDRVRPGPSAAQTARFSLIERGTDNPVRTTTVRTRPRPARTPRLH